MRKLILSIFSLAAMIFVAGSCSDVLEGNKMAQTETATFTVALPDGVDTKAISDGLTATELLFLAYDANGNHLDLDQTVPVVGKAATVTVDLVKGVQYQFVFWAQKPNQYTLDKANGKLTITPEDMMNSDAWDAFYWHEPLAEVTGPFSKEIVLKRPFAQINVGAPVTLNADNQRIGGDFFAANKSGIAIDNTLITGYTITVPNVLNLLDGAVSGDASIVMAPTAHPDEFLVVSDVKYDYAAMAYVLAGTTANNQNLTITIKTTQNGTPIELTRSVPNVPMRRNYRTNILGNLFSVMGKFEIVVDSDFVKDYLPAYVDIAALNEAFAKDATVAEKWSYKVKVLEAGSTKTIVLPKTNDPMDLVFANTFASEDITIEYAAGATDDEKPIQLTLEVGELHGLTANLPKTTLIIKDGATITNCEVTTASNTFVLKKNSSIENLTILGGGALIEGTVNEATVTMGADETAVISGTVKELSVNSGNVSVEATAEVKELNVTGTATAVVNTEANVETIVVENPDAVKDQNGDTPEGVKLEMCSAEALRQALASTDAEINITLTGNILDADGIFLAANNPKTLNIDLGGFTLGLTKAVGSTGTVSQGLHLEKNSTVVIKNGTITASAEDGVKIIIQNYANLTLEDVVVDGSKLSAGQYVVSNNCGKVNFIGSTSIKAPEDGFAFDACVTNYYADGTQILVNTTGKIEGKVEYGVWGSIPAENKVTLTIDGADLTGAVLVVDDNLLADAAEHIFVADDENVILSENSTFAPYQPTVTPAEPTVVLSQTFDNELTEADSSTDLDGNINDTYSNLATSSKAYQGANGTLKLGSSKAAGSVTTVALDLSSAFSVSIDVKQYGTDTGKVTVSVGEESFEITPTESFQTTVLNFKAATSASQVVIATTSKRAYIDNLVVTK